VILGILELTYTKVVTLLKKKIKRFTQGLSKVSYEYSSMGIIPHYKEPDVKGVCETFSPEENKYCPEPALRREDCNNHYFCEQCYQNYLNKYKSVNDEINPR
jgi:hypothetical protein